MKKRNGFTLVELFAVIVIIGVILTISVTSIITNMNESKRKAEEVFGDTIKNTINIYC